MGQGASGLVVGKGDKNSDTTLEFEPGHKQFTQSEKNRRSRGIQRALFSLDLSCNSAWLTRPIYENNDFIMIEANTDSRMDFQSAEDKDEEIQPSTSETMIFPQSVPTVFKWENGGNIVYLSGSFNGWNSRIPMHGRY